MKSLRLVLGDQLSLNLSSLADLDQDNDVVLMAEAPEEATYVPHHPKKIALVFAAMRHFAKALENDGATVHYVHYRDPNNHGALLANVEHFISDNDVDRIVVTEPGEWRLLEALQNWKSGVPVEIRGDDRFLCSRSEFAAWTSSRKQLRMEHFYRLMRRRHNILMDGDQPEGGQWNYDAHNRESLPEDVRPPARTVFEPNPITKDVLDLVEQEFSSHFGELHPFRFAVTREQALTVLDEFIQQRLHDFGSYQDAMRQGDPWLFHSHVSFYINIGLLDPREVLAAAEQAYHHGAPINAVEGFIRQVIGWREFVRGVYWHFIPGYGERNYFNAKQPLPAAYWGADTDLNCIKQCVKDTGNNAYAHHIQRLMVLGNFLLLTDTNPKDVNEWYLAVYADAFEWVEMPNVQGMAIFADGGEMASKPYAASGAYIHRMSNYCRSCKYSVTRKAGLDACPFNYLYWDFFQRHRDKLKGNPRLNMVYRNLDRMDDAKIQAVTEDAKSFLENLERG